jgi:hypothetical protein
MPDLIAEMRADLRENPLRREFVVLNRFLLAEGFVEYLSIPSSAGSSA